MKCVCSKVAPVELVFMVWFFCFCFVDVPLFLSCLWYDGDGATLGISRNDNKMVVVITVMSLM